MNDFVNQILGEIWVGPSKEIWVKFKQKSHLNWFKSFFLNGLGSKGILLKNRNTQDFFDEIDLEFEGQQKKLVLFNGDGNNVNKEKVAYYEFNC